MIDISPLDTLQLAKLRKLKGEEEEEKRFGIGHGSVSELGWWLKDNSRHVITGMQACPRSLSALHVELDGLIWAMTYLKRKIYIIGSV